MGHDKHNSFTVAFNHDCSGLLAEVADAGVTERAVERVFIEPLDGAVQVVDLCMGSAAASKCRTRHNRPMTRDLLERSIAATPGMLDPGIDPARTCTQGDVVEHFLSQDRDLLDVLLNAGRSRGMRVFANLRLNHSCSPVWMEGVPGSPIADGMRRDFRDRAYRRFVLELLEDFLARDVDGLSLDFERKAPFFPNDASQDERFKACREFLEDARAMTQKPLILRVAHDRAKGEAQGQQPEQWLAAGLVDVIVPATHNHEPDTLDWGFDRFLDAASRSPRRCEVWPQIWPTAAPWRQRWGQFHTVEQVARRVEDIRRRGADGVYLFNFHCMGSTVIRRYCDELIESVSGTQPQEATA